LIFKRLFFCPKFCAEAIYFYPDGYHSSANPRCLDQNNNKLNRWAKIVILGAEKTNCRFVFPKSIAAKINSLKYSEIVNNGI